MSGPHYWNLTSSEREVRLGDTIDRLTQERDDARAVANWLFGLLHDVYRNGKPVSKGDIPEREWLSFDFEPEICP